MATKGCDDAVETLESRKRVPTEKGMAFWLEKSEKKVVSLTRKIRNQERSVMQCVGSRGDVSELMEEMDELSELWKELEELCDKMCESVDSVRRDELERMKSVVGYSVVETLDHGKRGCRKSDVSVRTKKTKSKTRSRRTSSTSSSSLGILKMKLVEAELEMEEAKLECEMKKVESNYSRKRFELDEEEKSSRNVWTAQRAAKKFEIIQKHVIHEETAEREQELGSDDPDAESEANYKQQLPPRPHCKEPEQQPQQDRTTDPLNVEANVFMPAGNVDYRERVQLDEVNNEMCRLFLEQTAPSVQMDKFTGHAMDYRLFISKFKLEVERKIQDQSGRMVRLLGYTEGTDAHGIVEKHYWNEKNGYEEALKELSREYEDEHKVSRDYLQRLRDWPNVKVNDGIAMKAFVQFLVKAKNSLKTEEFKVELNGQENLRNILKKLSYEVQGSWNREVTRRIERYGNKPTFDMLLDFLELECKVSNNPSFSRTAMSAENESGSRGSERRMNDGLRGFGRGRGFSGQNRQGVRGLVSVGRGKKCHFCGMTNHVLDSCFSFRKLVMKDRMNFVRVQKKLCLGCLEPCAEVKHVVGSCRNRIICTICQKSSHPACLHSEYDGKVDGRTNSAGGEKDDSRSKSESEDHGATTGRVAASCGSHDANSAALSSVLVSVGSVETGRECGQVFCFIDSLANRSFISKELVDELGLQLKDAGEVDIDTMGGKGHVLGLVTNLRICGLLSKTGKVIRAKKLFCVESMPMDVSDIMFREEFQRWPHLRHLSEQIPKFDNSVPIGLLLGTDTHNATIPIDSVSSVGENTPYAVEYWLGWSGSGIRSEDSYRGKIKNFYCTVGPSRKHVSIVTESEAKPGASGDIERMFRKMYEEEFEDVKPRGMRSQEDQKFLEIMNSETKFLPELGQYEMPLPFRGGEKPVMPDNSEVAKTEAYRLRRRLEKHPSEKKKVVQFMNGMVEKDYARKVPDNQIEENTGRKWYLVYHPVKHPRKPDKTRIVFNGAKKHDDVCINQKLMVGPTKELGNDLLSVLVRWREESEAFVADIEDMFYRNRVEESDRSYLRYWWWSDPELNGQPEEYQMNVHIFGATSSPACANYALKRLAADSKDDFSRETIETLETSFYVDDCLKSCADVESARKCATELVELCKKGGYNLRKFAATDDDILKDLPECAKHKVELVKLADEVTDVSVERVLGMKWVVSNDELQFEISLRDRPATKRGMLSSISSIYDRLGLVQPFLLKGRKILQQLTNSTKIDWDDIVPDEVLTEWQAWYTGLQNLENVRVARCYKPKNFGTVVQCELHTFVDACEIGYGSCSYLRLVNESGTVHVAFVMGKSRVVPEKLSETIARCELVASVLGAELGSSLLQELTYENIKPFYWTDSKIVLAYLNNETRQFKTFVTNRIGRIKKLSNVENWNHVRSEDNVADDASRGLNAGEIDSISQHRWFTGPPSLSETSKSTEIEPSDLDQSDELEIQKETKLKTKSCASKLFITCRLDACMRLTVGLSTWWSMKRRIALLMKVLDQRDSEEKDYAIDVEDLCKAEDRIIKSLQMECFKEEMELLEAGKKLLESNRLTKFAPFLDGKGLMRVGGRLENWDTDFEVKYPVILPSDSHVTEAVVRDCHSKVAHSGRGITTNELRNSGFYILDMTSVVKRVIHNCVTCRKLRGACGEQKMAQLPKERLQEAPAFTYCCVDIAGPFICKNGRKIEKRYLAVFSDLVFRGVHIEVCYTLDKDSMINAVRRFVSRRGNCRYMKSDNGTNFTGCVNELRRAMLEVEPDLRRYLVGLGCDLTWQWNTPTRSHAGGVWERPIGTMRRILEALLLKHPHQLNDEELWTMICEVENMMNCRPITVDSLADPMSPTPLSPMTLLTQKTKVVLPPFGKFDKKDSYGRSWRKIQHFANEFWDRFRKEYFAEIQAYTKWTQLRRNLKVRDIVLMKDESLHRNDWPLAVVDEVFKDSDGLVRKARIRLGRKNWKESVKIYERPITKLVLLVENA